MSQLTAKEHAFVNSYIAQGVDVVGSKAAIEAGYAPKSAAVTASKLLKKTHISAEIARRRQLTEKKSALSAQKIYDELNNLVDFDIAQLYGSDGKLLKVNEMPLEARKAIAGIDGDKVRFTSRLGAIELGAKLLGMVKEQQTQQQAVQIIISQPRAQPDVTVETKQLKPEWD